MDKADKIYEFVNMKIFLLQKDSSWSRGMLAKLRRGVGKNPSEAPEIWEITLSELPDDLLYKGRTEKAFATEAEWAVHTALTLYAVQQQGNSHTVSAGKNSGGLSFGSAIRRLILPDGSNEEAIKRRFDAIITSSDLSELSHHARGLIQLMKASLTSITLDYPEFAKDLYFYQFKEDRNRVRLKWGQDFYNTGGKKKEEEVKNKEE